MMGNPKVSIIMPIYNGAACLRPCLDSLRCQTMTDFELICVDDGSKDETPEILAEYAQVDSRVKLLPQQNQGAGPARNSGLALATGEFVIFLDGDDIFEPNMLEAMTRRGEETGADIIVCRSDSFDHVTGKKLPSAWMNKDYFLHADEIFAPHEQRESLFQLFYGWPWDKLYRRDFLLAGDFRYPSLSNTQDAVFVYGTLAAAEKIALVDDCLVHYRMNRTTSISNSILEAPEAAHQAMELLEADLHRRGIYETFQQTFLNWVMEFLVWNLVQLPRGDLQQRQLCKLKKERFPHYQLHSYPRAYFHLNSVYYKYQLARFAPYWLFSMALSCHKILKSLKSCNF